MWTAVEHIDINLCCAWSTWCCLLALLICIAHDLVYMDLTLENSWNCVKQFEHSIYLVRCWLFTVNIKFKFSTEVIRHWTLTTCKWSSIIILDSALHCWFWNELIEQYWTLTFVNSLIRTCVVLYSVYDTLVDFVNAKWIQFCIVIIVIQIILIDYVWHLMIYIVISIMVLQFVIIIELIIIYCLTACRWSE